MLRLLSAVFAAVLIAAPVLAEDAPKCKECAKAKCEEMFAKLDTNKDGALSKEEFSACKCCKDEKAKEEKFTKLDADKDGKISKEEFLAGCAGCCEGDKEKKKA